VNKKS